MPKIRLPFQKLDANAWRRLGLVAILLLYLLNFIYGYIRLGLLNGIGSDFFAYWSAGKIVNQYGYDEIYNLDILKQTQYDSLDFLNLTRAEFSPIPIPYLSIYIIPFQFLSYLEPEMGYWVWTLLNLIILIGYSIFLLRDLLNNKAMSKPFFYLLVSCLIAFPVYANAMYGQVEVFLVICCGEFLRNASKKNSLASGAWLAGMLIKPQVLLLVIPALLFMKHWKVLVGFILGSGGVILSSILLSGVDGLVHLVNIWFRYSPGKEIFSPVGMANWRMLAVNINAWTDSNLGWIPAGLGMLITLVIWFRLILFRPNLGSSRWLKVMMAIFASSCAFTWHSHIHMGMVLLPFLLLFTVSDPPEIKKIILDYWIFSFPLAILISYLLMALTNHLTSTNLENIDSFLLGLSGLIFYHLIAISCLRDEKAKLAAPSMNV